MFSPDIQAKYNEIKSTYGIDVDGNTSQGMNKSSEMPWQLVAWNGDGNEDDTIGTVDDIGYHARHNVEEATRHDWAIPQGIVGYIVREDEQGFMYHEAYDSTEDLENAWAGIGDRYDAYFICSVCGTLADDMYDCGHEVEFCSECGHVTSCNEENCENS